MKDSSIYPNMNMSPTRYNVYCSQVNVNTQELELTMCKPLSEIRGCNPKELLEKCGQADEIPVNLSVLLTKLDISAIPMDFSILEQNQEIQESVSVRGHILGALVSNGDHAAIFYRESDKENEHRYRFTIAHELGHCCLTGELNHIEYRHDGETDDPGEIAANIFAGELLIPESRLNKILTDLILPSISVLADVFCVSENVMRARLTYLNSSKKIVGYNC